jgi:beta-glucosidase
MPRSVVDPFKGRDDAQHIAEESIVLLKNSNNLLPLKTPASIAIIGSHADAGVLSGGGSAQVDPPGGNVADPHPGGARWGETVYFPSSPMKYIQQHAPNAKVEFNPGTDNASAAALAKSSDVAIVFVNQPMYESHDARTLSLPGNQDALVSAVAAANPHTIVVLETGGPVTMPWADQVEGILAAWYPGIGGGQAIANLLFGDVNPSAKLPVTFAKSDSQLAFPEVPGIDLKPVTIQVPTVMRGQRIMLNQKRLPPFDVDYNIQGGRVGYKWFESKNLQPLFPFGFGLSYTTYEYSGLNVDPQGHEVSFNVKNTGSRPGAEIAEVYSALPSSANESYKRLVAFDRVSLAPGESKTVTLKIDPKYVSVFDEQKDDWQLLSGDYKVLVGPSSAETPLTGSFHIQ